MGQKPKFYVVWSGRQPGIYTSWDDCKAQVHGAQGARYKSFDSMEAAQAAFETTPQPPSPTLSPLRSDASLPSCPQNPPSDRRDTVLPLPAEVKANAIAVDAACSGNPGPMEYRGIYLATGQELFRFGPIYGTNNVGEFLAIVHGLALIKQQHLTDITLYSDSRNALLWIRHKKCKTKLPHTPRTDALFQLIERAERWLNDNTWTTPLIKWDTEKWGEIPADFGRK